MADKLEVRIITPDHVVFSRKAESVSLPGMLGDMEILPNHVSLFSTIHLSTTLNLSTKQ